MEQVETYGESGRQPEDELQKGGREYASRMSLIIEATTTTMKQNRQ